MQSWMIQWSFYFSQSFHSRHCMHASSLSSCFRRHAWKHQKREQELLISEVERASPQLEDEQHRHYLQAFGMGYIIQSDYAWVGFAAIYPFHCTLLHPMQQRITTPFIMGMLYTFLPQLTVSESVIPTPTLTHAFYYRTRIATRSLLPYQGSLEG